MITLRSLVFVVWMYGLLAVMSLACSPTFFLPRGALRACLNLWLDLVFWGLRVFCGVTWEVKGLEHAPQGPALIASKHQSMFETLAFWRVLPDPAIILKRELTYLPFFGWYAMKIGNIAVDRSAHARALKQIVRGAKQRVGENRQVLIFPEGTRTAPGAPPNYQPGVAALYRELGLGCTPVALNSGLSWPAHGVLRRPGHIVIEFLDPIAPGLDRRAFMRTLEDRIESASHALHTDPPQRPSAMARHDAATTSATASRHKV